MAAAAAAAVGYGNPGTETQEVGLFIKKKHKKNNNKKTSTARGNLFSETQHDLKQFKNGLKMEILYN